VVGPLLAILAALGSSVKAIFIKLAYREASVDSVTLLALRMVFSAPFFMAAAWYASRGQPALTRRDWFQLATLGFVGFYLASFLDFWGLEYISVGLERLILYTYPALVVVLGALFTGKTVGRREMGALALAFAGVALAFWADIRPATGNATAIWAGSAAVLGASLAYAIYVVGIGEMLLRFGSLRLTDYVITLSSFFVLGHFFATHPARQLIQPASIYWLAFAMAILSTVIPIFFTSEAVRRIGAARVSIIGFLGPVATIALGYWILGEPISAEQSVGTALVVAGVALVSRKKS